MSGSIPGLGRSLEKEMATHSRILAWEIPWTEELGGFSPGGCKRVGHDLVTQQQQERLDLRTNRDVGRADLVFPTSLLLA